MELYTTVGQKIRKKRVELELTQDKLSELCGLSSSYIGIIERAEKKSSLQTLATIANVLGLSADYLFKDAFTAKPKNRDEEILAIFNSRDDIDNETMYNVLNALHTSLK